MEILIAVVIMGLSLAAMLALYFMAQFWWQEGATRVHLQGDAYRALEKITRGVDGTGGLREARWVEVPDAQTVKYIDVDDIEKSIYVNGSDLMYDPNTTVADDEQVLVRNLQVAPIGFQAAQLTRDQIRVTLTLAQQKGQNTFNVEATSGVSIRN
ncbi:MAG: hypothetical protein HYY14_04705 [Candidatus Omnitrophica bacterium]|nr:hypothetical protein [Candidatus Omnitrophota bacterium]